MSQRVEELDPFEVAFGDDSFVKVFENRLVLLFSKIILEHQQQALVSQCSRQVDPHQAHN